MQLMSDDDAAYSALLAQLLSGSATSRNARVHSWIEHQYDFVLSEHHHLPFTSSRPPSPSPSSSLGAHRAYSIDRPDSPLLPRTSSPCPSYDALFYPTPTDDDFEEQERVRALRFIVQEMAQWKSNAPQPHAYDKPLPAPPPSPASSLTHSSSSRVMRSRSSSMRISRLPSFTSTLSSDQSQPQEIPPPLPVSVIVHGEYQHDLILRHDGYLHKRDDSSQDSQYLCPIQDDKDSFQPSPTLSNFSCAFSRETSITSPYASSPASPTNVAFSPCSPEDIALPASPFEEDKPFFVHERTPSSKSSHSFTVSPLKTNLFLASPTSPDFPPAHPYGDGALHPLCAQRFATHSQSRWSVATTASLAPSTTEPTKGSDPRTPPKDKKPKSLKTPKKRVRLISLLSRFSPGRNDPTSTTSSNRTGDDVEYDSANDSDDGKGKKPTKSLSKKSSLASLRASFTLSRASFSSQRPPLSSPVEEVPPLPMSPTITSPLAELASPTEAVLSSIPKPSLSRIPSRGALLTSSLPPIPQSASTITTFQSTSQLSVSDTSRQSASDSRVSLASPFVNPNNGSRISLLPPPSKRTSLASAAGVEPVISRKTVPASEAVTRTKSIFRLTAKPKSIKTPTLPRTKETPIPSRLPVAGNGSMPSPTTARPKIPHAQAKFNPPAKLATVIATQSRQAPALASPGLTSKLPTPPSRMPPKILRPNVMPEKTPAHGLPSHPPSSKLPMPAPTKSARVGTVKGFWKRQ